jgi:hypothetical protein
MRSNLFRFPHHRFLYFAFLFGATLAVRAETTEDKLNKSFQIKAGGKLVLEADRGSIEVKSADVERVQIEVLRKVTDESRAKAEEILKNHQIEFSAEGDKVLVHSQMNKEWGGKLWDKARHLQVHYQISVPKKFNVNLKTAGGSIKVSDLSGEVKSQTAGGSLNFGQIEGLVFGRTSGGSISVAGCKGDVDVKTSGGGVSLGDIEGNTSAHTSGGSISAKKLNGKAVVKTSGGSIDVADIKGSIEAGTSGGSVAAAISEQPSGDCRLYTSGGGIKVSLAEKVAVDVDAKTSGGRVVTDLPVTTTVQGEQKNNHLQGKVNGGGPALQLQTSGGSIHLKKM